MINAERLYPYRLEPQEKPAIWGGQALVTRYGKHADRQAAIGESWECWDANAVANGRFSGATLADVRRDLGADLMGSLDADAIFPVLTKFIDAKQALSVQVHPDDAYAQRVEHQPNGKTECWYILAAEPGAQLVLGWTRNTDRSEFERRVADGSLGEILRHVPVRAGDAFYLPAGTLHAIGAGIQLFEVQQASDLTYRIFDWNRLGNDGKPRDLHVAKAGDVLDFRSTARAAASPLTFSDGALERTLLIVDARFSVERVRVNGAANIAVDGEPITVTALDTPLSLQMGETRVDLAAFATVVAPAAGGALRVGSSGEMLVVRPRTDGARLRAEALRCGVAPARLDAFFEQFV